jgi:predicted esterase
LNILILYARGGRPLLGAPAGAEEAARPRHDLGSSRGAKTGRPTPVQQAPAAGRSGAQALKTAAALVALLLFAPVSGQTQESAGSDSAQIASPQLGELHDSIQSQADPTQSYALYLPPGYSSDRAWPLLVLMDPRGRALVPMTAAREAAKRFGYVVMSSYNTASDAGVEMNDVAFDAMLSDAQGALALDARRLYLVGLSGTARVAWDYAFRLGDYVAGVVGVGAGHEPTLVLPLAVREHGRPFAFFGTAGVLDFNYEELRGLDARLDELDFPHRVEYFDGGHEWPPARVFERALEWFQVQAMRSGYLELDEGWMAAVASRHLEDATMLGAAGAPREALRVYLGVAADFAELAEGGEAAERAAELAQNATVKAALDLEERLGEEDAAARVLFWEFVEGARGGGALDAGEVVRTLDIPALRTRAQGRGEEARAAQRLLEYVFVVAAFYEPRQYLADGELSRAQAFLEVADAVKPKHPSVCVGFARVYARSDRTADAMDALACAVNGGGITPETLETHADFESLREQAGFDDLVERARRADGTAPGP